MRVAGQTGHNPAQPRVANLNQVETVIVNDDGVRLSDESARQSEAKNSLPNHKKLNKISGSIEAHLISVSVASLARSRGSSVFR